MEACIVTQETTVEATAAARIGSTVCSRFENARVHMQKVGARYVIAIQHDTRDDQITVVDLLDLDSALDELRPADPPKPPSPPPPAKEKEEDDPKPDPFNVYLGAIYGGTSDMRPSPGAAIGFSIGEDDVQLHTEARFTGNPAHLWPFTPPAATPTKVSAQAGTDSFALATTVRVQISPHSNVGPVLGAGLAVEQVAQAHYANTGVAGVLEMGVELFHPKPVGVATILRADIPGFSVRTNGGPSHAPILSAGVELRF